MELINITVEKIDGTEKTFSINARELWKYFESKQDFSDWIKERIEKYGFVEGENYMLNMKQLPSGVAKKVEYIITLALKRELKQWIDELEIDELNLIKQNFIKLKNNKEIITDFRNK